jgi:hypothetical protein
MFMGMEHEHTWEERTLPVPKRVEYRFCPWCGTVQVKLGGSQYITVIGFYAAVPATVERGPSEIKV